MSKPWVCGFTEAEGSFYYVVKDSKTGRVVHRFSITQKLDPIILQSIKLLINIFNKVEYRSKYKDYNIESTNSNVIENVISYFSTSDKYLKSFKSFEFIIWARAYRLYKRNWTKLLEVRSLMNILKDNQRIFNKKT